MPLVAPASIDILQRVILSSIDIFETVDPANSKTKPVAPRKVMRPIISKITSFA